MNSLKGKLYRLLRSSEKYTKTDMVYVGANGFWLGIAQSLGIASSFLIAVLFANFVSQDVFGIYKYIISIAGFLSAFTLAGMNTSVVRAVAQGYDGTFIKSLPIQLKWSLPYFLLTLFVAGYYFFQGNSIYGFAFLIVTVFGPVASVANTFNSYLQGKKDFKTSTQYSIIGTFITFSITSLTIFFAPKVLWLIASYYVIQAFVNIFFCIRTIKKNPPKNNTIRTEDIVYAKQQSAMNIASSIAQQIDSILIYHLLGPVHLAVMSFATLIPDRIRSSFTSIVSLALPKLSEKKEGAWDSVQRKTLQLTLIALVLIILYVVCIPFIFTIFFPAYTSSIFYTQLYALSFILLPSYILVPTMLANLETKGMYVISVILPILKIFLTVTLIFFFNITGAIIAKVIFDFFYFVTSLFYVRKTFR